MSAAASSTLIRKQQRKSSTKGHLVDALARKGDEGRGRLRKAPASCQASSDPGMSEWGNLAGVMPSHSGLNT